MSGTRNSRSYVPLDCPYCEYMMRDLDDCAQYQITGCCTECWVGFLEPLRKLSADDGYLPSMAEIEDYRRKIRSLYMEKKDA